MTALLAPRAEPTGVIVIRPAPRREPPFDDELHDGRLHRAPFDRVLPFERSSDPRVWLPRPRPASTLPDPVPWGRRLLIGVIETAGGRRPLQQLAAMLSPGVATGLAADFERAAPHWTHAAVVRSVHASEPAEGVAELSATVLAGRRVHAVALRLEARDGRWRCTRLQLG
jgi:hypothetical protein